MAKINVDPETVKIGATISGIELERVDDVTFRFLNDALIQYKVLFFRQQYMTPAGLDRLARRFGDPEPVPIAASVPGFPAIALVESDGSRNQLSDYWHSDGSYFERPPAVTLLRAAVVPPVGGDTLWADMESAYDDLAPALKGEIGALRAVHSHLHYMQLDRHPAGYFTEENWEEARQMKEVIHPVVRTHPVSRRKSIYVNWHCTSRIEGVGETESTRLLDILNNAAIRPEYQCRLRWQPGTVAIWDNRCTKHYAVHDYGSERRQMQRITVAGEAPQ